jgi:hypothetical protein
MNTLKCLDCKYYDVIRSGQSSNPTHGWCAIKSIYPKNEEVGGPVFPPGVRRMERADLPSKPVIVEGHSVIPHCTKVVPK